MRLVTVLTILGLVSMACAYSDHRVDTIISDVTTGNLYAAVQTALQLQNERRIDLIREAVDALFENGVRNLFDFGYNIDHEFMGRDIFDEAFPVEVRRVLQGNLVRLINRQDYVALKLSSRTDNDGDRKAYGDGSGSVLKTIAWRFTPILENNKIYFHIFGIEQNQYLKLGYSADRIGDRTAYGGNNPTDRRYQWYLVPVKVGNANLFYIVNRETNQALKLGRSLDYDGDRVAYGHNGDYLGSPERFAWYLTAY